MDQEGEGVTEAQSEPITTDEPVARFEYDRGAYIRADGNPRTRAFVPKLDAERQRLETSVFRIAGLDLTATWALADLRGQDRIPPKAATGYCSLPASGVAEAGLTLQIDVPPDRHAVIIGWSGAENERLNSINLLAKAAAGRAVRRPNNEPSD